MTILPLILVSAFVILLIFVSILFAYVGYWVDSPRSEKMQIIARQFNLTYQSHRPVLSFLPFMRGFYYQKQPELFSLSRHIISGQKDGVGFKIYDAITYVYVRSWAIEIKKTILESNGKVIKDATPEKRFATTEEIQKIITGIAKS